MASAKSKRPGGNPGAEGVTSEKRAFHTTSPAAVPAAPRQGPAGNLIALFAEKWPACFFVYEKRRRPLAIGIHEQIISAFDGVASSRVLIQRALAIYVNNFGYLRQIKAGRDRIGLGGEPAGVVTAEEEHHSAPRLAACKQRRKSKKKKSRQPPEPAIHHLAKTPRTTSIHSANAAKPRLSLRKEVAS
jgi:sRNA-binding protein